MIEELQLVIAKKLDSLLSKKLLVFAIATVLMMTDTTSIDQWLTIAMLYIGVQGTIDGIRTAKQKDSSL